MRSSQGTRRSRSIGDAQLNGMRTLSRCFASPAEHAPRSPRCAPSMTVPGPLGHVIQQRRDHARRVERPPDAERVLDIEVRPSSCRGRKR